jgi:hypothetical protein
MFVPKASDDASGLWVLPVNFHRGVLVAKLLSYTLGFSKDFVAERNRLIWGLSCALARKILNQGPIF